MLKILLILSLLFLLAARLKRWLRITVAAPKPAMRTVKAEPLPELDYRRDQQ
jgi:hypothetical protein